MVEYERHFFISSSEWLFTWLLYYSITTVWWSKKKASSFDITMWALYCSQAPTFSLTHHVPHSHSTSLYFFIPLFVRQSDVTVESRQCRVTLVIWEGGRKHPGRAASLLLYDASTTDDSPACTMKVDDPNLSKARGGGVGEEGGWRRGIIRRRGRRCLRQRHFLIGRCPCPWHK